MPNLVGQKCSEDKDCEVTQKITKDSVLEHIRLINENLKADFAVIKPKIAVMGINPHGGDNGLMGREELDIITPAIKEAQKENIMVIGPYAPDGFFGSHNSTNFDAIVGMYHDQVLIPFKQIAFTDGINYTAGLPIIRTSPDHGTAYEIAGQGVADHSSFAEALFTGISIVNNRASHEKLSANPLKKQPNKRSVKKSY